MIIINNEETRKKRKKEKAKQLCSYRTNIHARTTPAIIHSHEMHTENEQR